MTHRQQRKTTNQKIQRPAKRMDRHCMVTSSFYFSHCRISDIKNLSRWTKPHALYFLDRFPMSDGLSLREIKASYPLTQAMESNQQHGFKCIQNHSHIESSMFIQEDGWLFCFPNKSGNRWIIHTKHLLYAADRHLCRRNKKGDDYE